MHKYHCKYFTTCLMRQGTWFPRESAHNASEGKVVSNGGCLSHCHNEKLKPWCVQPCSHLRSTCAHFPQESRVWSGFIHWIWKETITYPSQWVTCPKPSRSCNLPFRFGQKCSSTLQTNQAQTLHLTVSVFPPAETIPVCLFLDSGRTLTEVLFSAWKRKTEMWVWMWSSAKPVLALASGYGTTVN